MGLTVSLSTRMKSLILMILYVVASTQAGPTPGLEDGEAESRAVIACFTSWGRCTRWSSWATGWLWQTCDDKCRREEFTLEDTVSGRSPNVHWLTRPGIVSVMDSRDNFKLKFIEGEILNLFIFSCLQSRVCCAKFSL